MRTGRSSVICQPVGGVRPWQLAPIGDQPVAGPSINKDDGRCKRKCHKPTPSISGMGQSPTPRPPCINGLFQFSIFFFFLLFLNGTRRDIGPEQRINEPISLNPFRVELKLELNHANPMPVFGQLPARWPPARRPLVDGYRQLWTGAGGDGCQFLSDSIQFNPVEVGRLSASKSRVALQARMNVPRWNWWRLLRLLARRAFVFVCAREISVE